MIVCAMCKPMVKWIGKWMDSHMNQQKTNYYEHTDELQMNQLKK